MDFRDATRIATAELTPQPWDYTDSTGTTLTVIPAGLREGPGRAEVMIRATKSHANATEIGITTTDLPALLDALEQPVTRPWQHVPHWPDGTAQRWVLDGLTLTPDGDGFLVGVQEDFGDGDMRCADVRVPEAQRLPLASALRRAYDVARGWEN
ncbi:hypothetical protein [Actinacidiphila acididurans]|uniref:Uncharacterized protein n=1 Tax=Actinacidiphila acididurans TaxID=2784346 RepID=A0ABS2U2X0_9ACTN|nr:hypothetical protein [Actinacidiphila acididurans]MBM9509938.1 hypothetical protein [Actinacidiphila acididurans]